jgi:hypothetical protein
MKERPILFSGPMVRAILEGRKSQTRRVVKLTDSGRVKAVGSAMNWHLDDPNAIKACPYGMPGDRLWVREAWAVEQTLDDKAPSKFHRWATWFKADGAYLANSPMRGFHTGRPRGKWRSSLHMPRWASRITLEITEVRVERLQDISEEDAKAEGMEWHDGGEIHHSGWRWDRSHGVVYESCRLAYQRLWESINGPCSWAENPWVWVVSFNRVASITQPS